MKKAYIIPAVLIEDVDIEKGFAASSSSESDFGAPGIPGNFEEGKTYVFE